MLGFEYFPSPENDTDEERIAYQFLYCARAVALWQELSTSLFPEAIERERIEVNAINVFRDIRDAILEAIDTGNVGLMSQTRLLDRMRHAHAYLALYADLDALTEYRRMIYGEIDHHPPGQRDAEDEARNLHGSFLRALWEGEWNKPGGDQPVRVTRKETRKYRYDGIRKTDGLRDSILARKVPDQVPEPSFDPILPLFKSPSALVASDFLTPMQSAFSREAVRQLFLRAGLPSQHARFGVKMIFDGAVERDNPTAYKAILRKRSALAVEYQKVIDSR